MTVDYLADHTLLLALPAFLPAVVVVGVVLFVATRDRRTADDGAPDDVDEAHSDPQGSADEDGSP